MLRIIRLWKSHLPLSKIRIYNRHFLFVFPPQHRASPVYGSPRANSAQAHAFAFLIENNGVKTAQKLYSMVKAKIPNIGLICTDTNSCYEVAFKGIEEKHLITKRETHLIESLNSSIRDNLARFNRRSKRFSKTVDMLGITLDLFFNRHLFLTK